jgi:uncharacterized membrane protein YkvA (DUF1232 family)
MDAATPMLWREPKFVMNWRRQAQRLPKEAHVFYFVFKHPRTRWYTRCVAACTAGYLFSPVQLIPSFIPVIGFLDDFLVLFLGAKAVRRMTPPETRRKEEVRSGMARFAFGAIGALWLLAVVAASALVAAYIYH